LLRSFVSRALLHATAATAEESVAVSEAANAMLARELDEARLRAGSTDGLLHVEQGKSRERRRRIDELALDCPAFFLDT
jgi:hypothetical protein